MRYNVHTMEGGGSVRSLRIRQGAREARQILSEGNRLIGAHLSPSLILGALFALLPGMLTAFFVTRNLAPVINAWTQWFDGTLSTSKSWDNFLVLLQMTRQNTGLMGLGVTIVNLARSLFFKPFLLSALALLYNQRVSTVGTQPTLAAGRMVWNNTKNLIYVALACMLAEWFVGMLPTLVSGLLSAVAGILSFIPVLGTVAVTLAALFTELIPLLTDVAVSVVFCYVWITASCEGVTGFGALVRSWQLTRNAMHETVSSLFGLAIIRWIVVLALALLWFFFGRRMEIPLHVLLYAVYAANAIFTVLLGGVTCALYMRRPVNRGPEPGQFSHDGPDLSRLKRANLDGE